MCRKVIFDDGTEIETIDELTDFICPLEFVFDPRYSHIEWVEDEDCCLCPIDLEQTIRNHGVAYTVLPDNDVCVRCL